MTFTITFQWWMIPMLIIAVGSVVGFIIGNKPESGMFPMNPLFGFLIFAGSIITAIAMTIGHFL